MARPPSSATPSRRRSHAPISSPSNAPYGPEDFPGCEPFHLPAVELERYEGRLEFWDGRTETAWKACEPTTIDHELPTRRLPWLARALVSLRGSGIECLGSADLVCRDALGRTRWLMQADEVVYLHPEHSRPRGRVIDVARDPLPDVVLEVDYTMDVRRRKLSIYMEADFPEVWVLVPPGSRRAGRARVTIHVRDGVGGIGRWRRAPRYRLHEGRALPRAHRAPVVGIDVARGGTGGPGHGDARRDESRGRSESRTRSFARDGRKATAKARHGVVRRWWSPCSAPAASMSVPRLPGTISRCSARCRPKRWRRPHWPARARPTSGARSAGRPCAAPSQACGHRGEQGETPSGRCDPKRTAPRPLSRAAEPGGSARVPVAASASSADLPSAWEAAGAQPVTSGRKGKTAKLGNRCRARRVGREAGAT